jgi:DNA repair protein RecN (Recombination protein N)
MLTELLITNFAIIDSLDIKFEPGLIIFTGETGAGKSIIIDAVETVLGGRADSAQVRTGAERAMVEATFNIPDVSKKDLQAILKKDDLLDEPDYLTLAREIRLTGRNVARINGHSVTAHLLRKVGNYLIDIHGQSEHLSLLRVRHHLELLDQYAATLSEKPHREALDTYRQTYKRLLAVQTQLDELHQIEQDSARRVDVLSYQIKEIESAQLQPDEEQSLKDERNRLANAETLASISQEAILALDEGTPDAPATTDLFGQVTNSLSGLSRLDQTQSNLYEQSLVMFEDLNELAKKMRTYLESIEFNPKRLDQVEERLALIYNLKRKYGDSIQEVLDFASSAKNELEKISHSEEHLQELAEEKVILKEGISRIGQELSTLRHTAAKRLEQAIEAELDDLHMSRARFQVNFQLVSDPNGVELKNGRLVGYYAHGLEQVEFLIETNPGEGFKPLVKIASGGETSRLMLALKYVLSQADQVPTLIFDEIDQGIGGRVGGVVGKKLWGLGRQHQVLCITHLPQLAAYGEQHYHVEKQIQGDRTITHVNQLHRQDRIVELAQMMGALSDSSLQTAHDLINSVLEQESIS